MIKFYNVFKGNAQRVIIYNEETKRVIPTSDGSYSYPLGMLTAVSNQLGLIDTEQMDKLPSRKDWLSVLSTCKTASVIEDSEKPYGISFDDEGNPVMNTAKSDDSLPSVGELNKEHRKETPEIGDLNKQAKQHDADMKLIEEL